MSLTGLAETILAKAKELDQRGVVDADSKAIRDLERLSLGPLETLHDLIFKPIDIISLQAAGRYELPLHVPDAGIPIHDLAAQLRLDEETLARLLRHGVSNGIFDEPSAGTVAHTSLSRLLRDDPDALGMLQFVTAELWPTALHALDALDKWPAIR
ncbi:hypothetical protein B0J12DRAFT_728349 [Macrophomina phaseolina]|uniref:Uncharacterized protein n=1 Tax=Macrophomina phaseolina TaxID=35725 RepID=A0ABQ8GAD1_9PEZI|nr:hypothetical protein B0J12DRAFT_728349 [Macrophomina phaseolina]